MDNYEKNWLTKRPQRLCKMCGRCCRTSTTSNSYEDLLKMCEAGDEGAIAFLSIFEPYPSIEAARVQDAELVDNILGELGSGENVTFYGCKYIRDDNLCGNYETRPLLCHHCPSTPWAVVPPGCGFENWLLWKREEDKQKVRRSKEQLQELELMYTDDPETIAKIERVKQTVQKTIDMYKKFGSEYW
jgi:Fe-S-cluster containining protein